MHAQFARTCHRIVEHVDNRRYALEVIEGDPPSAAAHDWAIAAGPFDGDGASATMARLRALGFTPEVIEPRGSTPLVIGRRAR